MADRYVRGDFTEKTIRDALASLNKVWSSLTDFEQKFIGHMESYVGIYDAIDNKLNMGITVKQYNLLIAIRDERA